MTRKDFNETIATQSDFLEPYAHSLTKDMDDAKDLQQETLFRALTNRDKFIPGTNLKAWLYTIMRNIFINDYRRHKRFGKTGRDVGEKMLIGNASSCDDNTGWSNVRFHEAKKEIEKLPGAYRESFELYYMGFKYRDIAGILAQPLGTIKSRIHFARKILISKLDR